MKKIKLYFELIVSFIAVAVIFFAVFMGISHYSIKQQTSERNKISVKSDSVYCRIIETGYLRKHTSCKYSYSVDDKLYNGEELCNRDVRVGEMYKIVYSIHNPSRHYLMFEYPALPIDKDIDTVCCEVIQLDSHDVRFKYSIHNVTYKRFQKVLAISPLYQLGKTYQLHYLHDDPQSSYVINQECK